MVQSKKGQSLDKYLLDGSMAIFAGSGISKDPPSNLPLWSELANELLSIFSKQYPNRNLNPFVKELINAKLPPELILEQIAKIDHKGCKKFISNILKKTRPNIHHHRLAGLSNNIKIYVTTNYDDCLEQAFEEKDIPYDLLLSDDDFLKGAKSLGQASSKPIIAKLHGDVSEPDAMIVTLSEGRCGLSGAKRLFMAELFKIKYFLFVGYSGGDLYIDDNRLLMRQVVENAMGFTWTCRKGSEPHLAVETLVDLYRSKECCVSVLPIELDELLTDLCQYSAQSPHCHRNNIIKPKDEGLKSEPEPDMGLSLKKSNWPTCISTYFPALAVGELLLHIGKLDSAKQIFQEVADLTGNGPYYQNIYMAACFSLIRIEQRKGNHIRALEISETIHHQLKNEPFFEFDVSFYNACLLVIEGESLSISGRIQEALDNAKEACDFLSESDHTNYLLIALGNYGNYLLDFNKLDSAQTEIERACELAVQFGDVEAEAAAHNNLGLVFMQYGNFNRSLAAIEKSLKLSKSIMDSRGICNGLNNYGLLLRSFNRLDESYLKFKTAKKIGEENNYLNEIGAAENGMGMVAYYSKNYTLAKKHWINAIGIYYKTNYFLGHTEVLSNMAEVLRIEKEFDQAEENINHVIKILMNKGFELRSGPYFC